MTHDHERHGTTTLVAAMNVLDGIGHRPQHAAPSPSGVHSLPQCHREAGSCWKDDPRHRRQLRPPQVIPTFADGSNAIPHGVPPISPRHRPLGSPPSRASSQPSQSEGSSAASFAPSPHPCRDQPLPRRAQSAIEGLHLDRRSRQNHRRSQARAPSVRFDPLEAFRRILLHDIQAAEFADVYAQTITCGLFTARLHELSARKFSRMERPGDQSICCEQPQAARPPSHTGVNFRRSTLCRFHHRLKRAARIGSRRCAGVIAIQAQYRNAVD